MPSPGSLSRIEDDRLRPPLPPGDGERLDEILAAGNIEILYLKSGPLTFRKQDGVRTIDLKFVNRVGKEISNRKRPSTSSTLFGLVADGQNVWVCCVKTLGKVRPGQAMRAVLESALSSDRFQSDVWHIDITPTLRKEDTAAFLAELRADHASDLEEDGDRIRVLPNVTVRVLGDEEMSPVSFRVVDPLKPMFHSNSFPDDFDHDGILHELLACLKREAAFRIEGIDDDLSLEREVRTAPDLSLDHPKTAVVGLSGSGKSSLISAMLGLVERNIPAAGASRTTLCPITFVNQPSNVWTVDVEFLRREDILERVRQRIERAAILYLKKPGPGRFLDREVTLTLLRSEDSTFDLRMIFGPHPTQWRNNEAMRFILDRTLGTFWDIMERKGRGEDAFLADEEIHFLSSEITDAIAERIETTPFGLFSTRDGSTESTPLFPEVFSYGSHALDAAISVLRRFTSTRPKHFGKLFGPLVKRVIFRGPILPDRKPFCLIDTRGFDHDGDLDHVAGRDVLDSIAMADRVLIVESAMKSGDRASMGLVAQIVASGQARKVFFAQTKVDELISSGVEPSHHIRNGLENGLNGLSEVVGRGAIESIRDTMQTAGIFSFGNLHRSMSVFQQGLAREAEDPDFLHDNAGQASRLLLLMSSRPDEIAPEISVMSAGPTYEYAAILRAIRKALQEFEISVIRVYGDEGENSGPGTHWGRIKWNVRHMIRFFSAGPEELPSVDVMMITAMFHKALTSHVSGALDAPNSWSWELQHDARGGRIREGIVNSLRKHVSEAFLKHTIRIVILDMYQDWVATDALSWESFGPGSTYERSRMIRDITARIVCQAEVIARLVVREIASLGSKVIESSEGREA